MKKRTLNYSAPRLKSFHKPDESEKFHPISYYLNGGLDLTNQELRNDAKVLYDSEDEVTPDEQGEISSAAMCDPRVSFFDMVEQFGKEAAEQAVVNSPKPGIEQGDSETE